MTLIRILKGFYNTLSLLSFLGISKEFQALRDKEFLFSCFGSYLSNELYLFII